MWSACSPSSSVSLNLCLLLVSIPDFEPEIQPQWDHPLFWPGFFCTVFGLRPSLNTVLQSWVRKATVSELQPRRGQREETLLALRLSVLPTPCCLSKYGRKCLRRLQSSPEHLRTSKRPHQWILYFPKPEFRNGGRGEGSVWSFHFDFSPPPRQLTTLTQHPPCAV